MNTVEDLSRAVLTSCCILTLSGSCQHQRDFPCIHRPSHSLIVTRRLHSVHAKHRPTDPFASLTSVVRGSSYSPIPCKTAASCNAAGDVVSGSNAGGPALTPLPVPLGGILLILYVARVVGDRKGE